MARRGIKHQGYVGYPFVCSLGIAYMGKEVVEIVNGIMRGAGKGLFEEIYELDGYVVFYGRMKDEEIRKLVGVLDRFDTDLCSYVYRNSSSIVVKGTGPNPGRLGIFCDRDDVDISFDRSIMRAIDSKDNLDFFSIN
jgi:hypothetical protein